VLILPTLWGVSFSSPLYDWFQLGHHGMVDPQRSSLLEDSGPDAESATSCY